MLRGLVVTFQVRGEEMGERLGRERILLLSLRSILLVDWVQFTGSLGSGFLSLN